MQQAGWVEVIDREGARALARGHLLVDDYELADGAWHGHLDSIHRLPDAEPLTSGEYVLRFDRSAEQRLVRFEISGTGVRVYGEDGVVPAAVTELAEGT